MILLAICTIFLLLYAALIFYYRKGWTMTTPQAAPANPHGARLSVVVAARNEEATIGRLLDALEKQSLSPELFEVIIADDHSTDDTRAVVLRSALPVRLLTSAADAGASSKKKAIETGVLAAAGELIVTTDADCVPGPHWLRSICDCYVSTGANFIAAPVKFLHDDSALQRFQALDFMTLQGITAASVRLQFHTMCNGANLAYRRQCFLDVRGFEGIDRVPTGDDMLLMHKIWKLAPARVVYLKEREAIMTTQPAATWKEFINQRKRWASKTFVYDDRRIPAVLIFVYLLNVLFPVLIATAFWHSLAWLLALGFLVVKTLIEVPFVSAVAGFYGERRLLRHFFFFQPLHILYTVSVGLLSQVRGYEWKGRRTK